jgi:putative mRNA 3-end processing factor
MSLLIFNERGIYCPPADVYIDPWRPVRRAIITHAHADHARPGHQAYLAHHLSAAVLRQRLGKGIRLQTIGYGKKLSIRGVQFSLHPAGHIPGSAQVRVEYRGAIWVVSGDYKLEIDGLSTPFEPVPCHHFITECTFGLPVYRWPRPAEVEAAIKAWWQANRAAGKVSLLAGYSLGKAQRLLQGLDPAIGPIFTHGAVENVNEVLRRDGHRLPPTQRITGRSQKKEWAGALVIAPPSAIGTPWSRKLGVVSTAFASGWMALRGTRRRRAADRGFVVSDHADWPGLQTAVRETGAQHVYATHGYTDIFSRWLREQGLDAQPVETLYEGESLEKAATGYEETTGGP